MQDGTTGRHRSKQRRLGMRTLATAVTVLAVLAGAGWTFAATYGTDRVTSGADDPTETVELVGASGTDATGLTTSLPVEPRVPEMSAATETHEPPRAPDPVTAVDDVDAADAPDATPSAGSGQVRDDHAPPERRFLETVRHPGVSADVREARDRQLIRLGADMCRMVEQFGGDRAAAERGLTTAFRRDGQPRLARDGGRLLNTAVRFLCPQYR